MLMLGEVVEALVAYGQNQGKSGFRQLLSAISHMLLSSCVGAMRCGVYEGAIALTTLEATTIMNRFHWEMS